MGPPEIFYRTCMRHAIQKLTPNLKQVWSVTPRLKNMLNFLSPDKLVKIVGYCRYTVAMLYAGHETDTAAIYQDDFLKKVKFLKVQTCRR